MLVFVSIRVFLRIPAGAIFVQEGEEREEGEEGKEGKEKEQGVIVPLFSFLFVFGATFALLS